MQAGQNLRVVYAGHNFFAPCLYMLESHPRVDVVACMTSSSEGPVDAVVAAAERMRVPVFFGRSFAAAREFISGQRVDLLVAAAYHYRIPIETLDVGFGVNVHPTLLPHGRGPNPLPHVVSRMPAAAGVTVHELTPEFDAGSILAQESIELSPTDGVNEYYLKLLARSPVVLRHVVEQFNELPVMRRSQGQGSYWPELVGPDRRVSACEVGVVSLLELYRTFGFIGLDLELLDGATLTAKQLSAVTCDHDFAPGTLVAQVRAGSVVALKDGLALVRCPT